MVQVAAGDGQHGQPASRQSAAGELPSYVDCQTNIMRLTKQVAQTVQEMVSIQLTMHCAYVYYKSNCF